MSLITVGVNHKTAPVAIRERVAFTPEKMIDALLSFVSGRNVSEIVILSTCNRTELYCYIDYGADVNSVIRWLSEYHKIDFSELKQYCYVYVDDESVRHIMHVASGLDSLILGEPQILGQVKSAYAVSQRGSFVGPELQSLFQRTFSIAKRVRTDTAIGENPVSIAFAAVSLAQRIFADVRENTALLIGAGQTIELVARHLREQGIRRIIFANRTLARAQSLADELGAEAIMLGEIGDYLAEADIVISSTASQLPIIGKGLVEKTIFKRRYVPILLIDIAVPRDIEPEVEEVSDAYLYTVDDLHSVIEQNIRARKDAVQAAEVIIEEGVYTYRRSIESRKVSDLIVKYRRSADDIKNVELEKAMKSLESGQSPEQVINKLAHGLMNKLIHSPTCYLRDVGTYSNLQALTIAASILGIDEDKDN